jgi:hypothetical protein
MATYVTVSNGLVTNIAQTNGDPPPVPSSLDAWIDVSALNPHPVVGDQANDDGTFTLNHTPLTVAKGGKIGELRDAAGLHINAGFPCGQQFDGDSGFVGYWYPAAIKDQLNIGRAYSNAVYSGVAENATFALWCARGASAAEAAGWDMRFHTLAQAIAAGTNLRAHVEDAQFALKDLVASVLEAQTTGSADAIVWSPLTD